MWEPTKTKRQPMTFVEGHWKARLSQFYCNKLPLGLVEINAVRASVDSDELGDFLPHVRSLVAYDAESKTVESMRPNGAYGTGSATGRIFLEVLLHYTQLDAWNWETQYYVPMTAFT